MAPVLIRHNRYRKGRKDLLQDIPKGVDNKRIIIAMATLTPGSA